MNKIDFTRFADLDYTGDEALNTLCTNLTFAGEGVSRIMMTSCHASEGKSMISMNMMRTFARLGKRVVLVDADLRRSVLLARYGGRVQKGAQFGLTHYLAGMCSAEDALYETNISGAYIVPVGREVGNSLSPCSPSTQAWMLEASTPVSSESMKRRRRLSSTFSRLPSKALSSTSMQTGPS